MEIGKIKIHYPVAMKMIKLFQIRRRQALEEVVAEESNTSFISYKMELFLSSILYDMNSVRGVGLFG